MSDAQIAGYAGMAQTIVGGIASAFGNFFTGEAQQQMFNYQAGVARLNQQIANQNALYTRNIGEWQAVQAGLRGAQQLGQIKIAQAASGLDVNSGSATQVRASQQELTSLDLASIRSNAAKIAYNYETLGVQYQAQAGLDTLAGQNARTAGMIGAESSLIGAASSVSSEWMRGQQIGLWGQSGGGSNNAQPLGGSGTLALGSG